MLRAPFELSNRTNGRYDVRMLFNGTWRRVRGMHFLVVNQQTNQISRLVCRVQGQIFSLITLEYSVIDDHLPYHPTEGTLMCMSVLPRVETSPNSLTSTTHTLWPSLLEKAVCQF